VDEVAFSIRIYFIGYVYMCLIYTCVATIRIPNSACQNWECNCVDEVACSIYIHFCRCCLCVYLSTQLRLPTGSVLAWPKPQSRYLIRIYVSVICIYIATLRLPNSACPNWECNCVDEVVCSIYYFSVDVVFKYSCLLHSACRQGVCLCGQSCYSIRIYVSDIYIYCHYSSTQLRLPQLGV